MANFASHVCGGAAVSAIAAIWVFSRGWVDSGEMQALFLLGVIGGLLPDIDSDSSTSVRGFFTLLGVLGACLVSLSLAARFPLIDLALVWGAVFLSVRFGLFEVFSRFTVHRGIWHSLLGVVFVGLACASGLHHLGGYPAFDSWLAGFFLSLGYLTHLCLDEMASVDILGNRVRRSFGTALKPFAVASPRATLAMVAGVLAFSVSAPTIKPLLDGESCQRLSERLVPGWIIANAGWLEDLCVTLEHEHGHRESPKKPAISVPWGLYW